MQMALKNSISRFYWMRAIYSHYTYLSIIIERISLYLNKGFKSIPLGEINRMYAVAQRSYCNRCVEICIYSRYSRREE